MLYSSRFLSFSRRRDRTSERAKERAWGEQKFGEKWEVSEIECRRGGEGTRFTPPPSTLLLIFRTRSQFHSPRVLFLETPTRCQTLPNYFNSVQKLDLESWQNMNESANNKLNYSVAYFSYLYWHKDADIWTSFTARRNNSAGGRNY